MLIQIYDALGKYFALTGQLDYQLCVNMFAKSGLFYVL
jgi:hypothetical protein